MRVLLLFVLVSFVLGASEAVGESSDDALGDSESHLDGNDDFAHAHEGHFNYDDPLEDGHSKDGDSLNGNDGHSSHDDSLHRGHFSSGDSLHAHDGHLKNQDSAHEHNGHSNNQDSLKTVHSNHDEFLHADDAHFKDGDSVDGDDEYSNHDDSLHDGHFNNDDSWGAHDGHFNTKDSAHEHNRHLDTQDSLENGRFHHNDSVHGSDGYSNQNDSLRGSDGYSNHDESSHGSDGDSNQDDSLHNSDGYSNHDDSLHGSDGYSNHDDGSHAHDGHFTNNDSFHGSDGHLENEDSLHGDSHLKNDDPLNDNDDPSSTHPLNNTGDDAVTQRTCFPIPDRYIVQFRNGTDSAVRTKLLRELQTTDDIVGYDHVFLGFATSMHEDEVQALLDHPDVEIVEQDHHCTGSSGAIRQTNSPWNLGRISHRRLGTTWFDYDWSAGRGTCAYVLDTGVDVLQPEFSGRVQHLASYVANAHTDDHGHGTHIAGVIAGTTYGVAKQAYIYGIKVLNDACGGSIVDVIKGLDHIYRHMRDDVDARRRCPLGFLVNLAISYPASGALNLAVSQLVQANAFVVVAAGNENANAGDFSPQMVPGVCVVGATDRFDRPLFDLQGSTSENWGTNWGPRIDVFAPGAEILSAWPYGGMAVVSGTSQAAPHVVGMAAVMMSGGERARGTALCERIKALASRNAIVGLQPRSENRLAFLSATPQNAYASTLGQTARQQPLRPDISWEFRPGQRPAWCTSFNDLFVLLDISASSRALTRGSIVEVRFPGAGRGTQVIGGVGNRGQSRWQQVDMAGIFSATTFPVDRLTDVVVDLPPASGACTLFSSSPWRVKRVMLRARCTPPSRGSAGIDNIWLQADKSISTTSRSSSIRSSSMRSSSMRSSGSRTPGSRTPGSRSSGRRWKCLGGQSPGVNLAMQDWQTTPGCSHFRQISIKLTMANELEAGTSNDINVRFGTGPDIRIAHQPRRGTVHFLDVPMQTAFGQPFVQPEHLSTLTVTSVGPATDYCFPQEITIKAVCYGEYSVVNHIERQSGVWLAAGTDWIVDIRPDAWTVTWASRMAAQGGSSGGQETSLDQGEEDEDGDVDDPRARLEEGIGETEPSQVHPHVMFAES